MNLKNRAYSSNKKSFLMFYAAYTFLFAVIFLFGYCSFWIHGKSFIWNCDGYNQHFPALIYIGRYYRRILLSILSGDFNIPLFDFNIGMGENIIATLNYYGLGDPFVLLSAFVPAAGTETLYEVLIVLRMYLSGIAFSAFCFYFKKQPFSVLIGSITYVFCGYALVAGVRHPFFINPMIFLPLMLIGLDLVLRKKSPIIFILTVFISAITGFYFLYMMSLFIFVYALIRFKALYKSSTFKELIKAFVKSVSFYLVGIMMASILFLPVIYGFFSSSRISGHITAKSLLLPRQCLTFLLGFIAGPASWDYLNIAAIAVPAVVVLFLKRDEKLKPLKIGFIIAFIAAMVPLGGYIMNGFGYVSNRWTFAFSFLVAFIVVCMLPSLFKMSFREQFSCLAAVIIYGILCFVKGSSRSAYTMLAFGMLALTTAMLFFIQIHNMESNQRQLTPIQDSLPQKLPLKGLAALIVSKSNSFRRLPAFLLCIIIVLNLISNAVFLFAPDKKNYVSEFTNKNTALSKFQNYPAEGIEKLKQNDRSFYRLDSKSNGMPNASMLRSYPGVSVYYSIINSNMTDFRRKFSVSPSMSTAFNLGNLDSRAALETLSSVKYFALGQGSSLDYVPYGFEKTDIPGVYYNKYALPLGYTYDSYITESEFNKMGALERQEAALQTAIIDGEVSGCPKGRIKNTVKKLNCAVKTDGAEWRNGELIVKKPNAKINVTFNGLSGSETYIRLEDLILSESGVDFMTVGVSSENINKTLYVRSEYDNFYYGENDYLINLGYRQDGITSASLEFTTPGRYKLKGIEVFCIPVDNFEKYILRLSENTLKDVTVSPNRVSGKITLGRDKILCLTIPYSSGWTATVDSKPVKILKANTLFMAIPLKKGSHTIELHYFTPGLKPGAVLSAFGFIIFIVLSVIYFKRSRKARGYMKTKTHSP